MLGRQSLDDAQPAGEIGCGPGHRGLGPPLSAGAALDRGDPLDRQQDEQRDDAHRRQCQPPVDESHRDEGTEQGDGVAGDRGQGDEGSRHRPDVGDDDGEKITGKTGRPTYSPRSSDPIEGLDTEVVLGQPGPDIGLHPHRLGHRTDHVGQRNQGQPAGKGSSIGRDHSVINGAAEGHRHPDVDQADEG